jgi:hypothetical protein
MRKGRFDHFQDSTPSSYVWTTVPAVDVRLMLSSPMYVYGTYGLLPAERVAEEVMKLNAQIAQEIRDSGVTYSLADLDQQLQAILQKLEADGIPSALRSTISF